MCKELEFTGEQIQRIDEVENAVFDLCRIMVENANLERDKDTIGNVVDAVIDILVEKGHKVRYPAIVTNGDDKQEIIDYFELNNIDKIN